MIKLATLLGKKEYQTIAKVIEELLDRGAKSATKYMSEKRTIRASLKTFGGKMPPVNTESLKIVLTIGKPNYEAREFIKDCKKAGEPFPVKKIQLNFFRR